MITNSPSYSIIDHLIINISKKLANNQHSLLTTLVTGLLTYLFAFMHKLPNWDDASLSGLSWVGADHGRWMLNVVDIFMPDLSMPWIYGIMSLIIQAIAICYILKIFSIQNKKLQCILSALIVSFPSLVGMMSYMLLSYSYSMALLLAVLAVYYIKDTEIHELFSKKVFLAWLFSVLSMGFYQAYVSISITFLLVLIIKKSLIENFELKKLLLKGLWYLLFVLIAMISYYLINELIFYIFDLKLGAYAADKMETGQSLIERVYWLIVNQISMVLYGTYGFIPNWGSRLIHFVLFIYIALALFVKPIQRKEWGRCICLLFLCFCLPFAINCIHLIAPTGTHSLTLLPFFTLYVLVGLLVQEGYKNKSYLVYDFICVLLFVLMAHNILLANKNHLKQYIQFENATAYWNRVLMRIESHPDFNKETKIALVGNPKNRVTDLSQFGNDEITGIAHGIILDIYSRTMFIKTYIGFVSDYASQQEIDKIKETAEYQAMSIYPYNGSIRMIKDLLVVVRLH